MLLFIRIKLINLSTNLYLLQARLVSMQLELMLRLRWNYVETMLYQLWRRLKRRCTRFFQGCLTLGSDVVLTLYKVENLTSSVVSFSNSDQRYFNVDPQRWNNVHPTLKCWLVIGFFWNVNSIKQGKIC